MSRWRESTRAFGDAFGNPGIRRLELAWAGASLGTWAYTVGVAVFAYDHGGVSAVGIVGFARWGAGALLSPWLALAADRYRRRYVMIAADGVRTAALAIATVAVAAHWPALLVYVLAGVVSTGASAFHPAEAALRPSLARSAEELTAANVVSSAIAAVGALAGPALGGALLAVGGVEVVFAASAAAMLWSALLVLAIRVDESPPPPLAQGSSVLAEAFAGFAAIFGDAKLRLVMGLLTAQLVVNGIMAVLVVVLAFRLLGLGQAGVGWLSAAEGIGAVAGAGVSAVLVGRRRIGADFGLGLVLYGLPLVVLGLWTVTPVAVVLLALVGVGGTVADVAGMTVLQRVAPEAVLARVFGVFETVILLTLALGSLVAPALVAGLGGRGALIAAGVVLPVLLAATWRLLATIDRDAVIPRPELDLLLGVPIFAPLAAPELERLARSLEPLSVPEGATVFAQGDPGDRFYLVESGRAAVEIDGRTATVVEPGGFFGEIALLRDVPRTATVRALEPLLLYALAAELFVPIVAGHAASRAAADAAVGARLGAV